MPTATVAAFGVGRESGGERGADTVAEGSDRAVGLYLNSAMRLKRSGIVRPEPAPAVKLARAPKLD